MKFRELDDWNEDLREKITKGTLAKFVAKFDPHGSVHRLESRLLLAFSLCWIADQYVLDMIDEQEAERVFNDYDENMG